MRPVRIEFDLNRPMRAPEMPIHLDALLAWAAVNEAEEAGDPNPLEAQEALPLAQEEGEGGAVWCASQVIFRPAAPPHNLMMTKRFELAELAAQRDRVFTTRTNTLTQGTGPYKGFVLNVPVVWAFRAVAYAIGDAERIEELLQRVTSLGKLRRLMLGAIVDRRVIEDPAAEAHWRLRVMPRPQPGYATVEAVTRPPYWKRVNRRVAFMPVTIPEDAYARA